MSVSNCGNDSNTQKEQNLPGFPGNHDRENGPVVRPTNVPESVVVTRASLLSQRILWNISKFRLFRFLLVLTVSFFFMVSYILWWYKKGLVFNPTFHPPSPSAVSARTQEAAAGVSCGNTSADMKSLVEMISSKLEYSPRKVPEKLEVTEMDPQFFSKLPRKYLSNIKSPCWHEQFTGQSISNQYKRIRTRIDYKENIFQQGSKQFQLRCLPYFYLIGQPKCGTTDLFHRLHKHPEIQYNIIKEPHWWTRRRFANNPEKTALENYMDVFFLAAKIITGGLRDGEPGDQRALKLLTADASASTMWDNNQLWSYYYKDREYPEPEILNLDFIHAVNPDAKILVILRDPVQRLYSEYLYFRRIKSPEDFHDKVQEAVELFTSCLSQRSLHYCVYNPNVTRDIPVRLHVGMYVVFLLDWMSAFSREQILILQLEDYSANMKETMTKVFHFLDVEPLSEEHMADVLKTWVSNARRPADRSLGPMLPETKELLKEFYQPFNRKLASVLENKAFLWSHC